MARSSDVIARVADATGEPHSGVLYVIRALRKDPDLFIKGRQGASRNAPHAQPHHLVNLLIGILTAKQAALRELPDLVGRYRGMTLFGLSPDNPMARAELEGLHNRAGLADRTATLQNFLTALGLPPGTLGQALDALVRGPDRYRPGSLTLQRDRSSARLSYIRDGGGILSALYNVPREGRPDASGKPRPVAEVRIEVSIDGRIFALLHDLTAPTPEAGG